LVCNDKITLEILNFLDNLTYRALVLIYLDNRDIMNTTILNKQKTPNN